MMSTRTDAVRAAYEMLDRPGGLDELAGWFLSPDVDLDFSALPDGRVLRGIEAFREFRRDGPWSGPLRLEPEEMIELDADRVLVLVRVRSVARSMGMELEGRFAHLLTFRGERVVRWKLFADREEARRAAGLDAD